MNLFKKNINAPWTKFYKKEQLNFEIPNYSIYKQLELNAIEYKNHNALNYFGKLISYEELINEVNNAAKSFRSYGIRPGDIVTICMPNTPEGLISIYALNKIGAVANIIHPLSATEEIKNYLNETDSVMLVAVDFIYEKIEKIINDTKVYKTILVSPGNSMPITLRVGYYVTKGIKNKLPKNKEEYIMWNDFIKKSENYNLEFEVDSDKNTPAIILHSGGTTGTPKAILLSNGNFNALSKQIQVIFKKITPGDKILAILPIFHGFGLGVSIHSTLNLGCEVVMIPQFKASEFDSLMKKYNPAIITGVPTLYEALTKNKGFEGMDLSFLKYVISGGDSLSKKQLDTINKFLKDHNSNVVVEQGYGMTEALGAVSLAFGNANVPCSIGIPFPQDYIKIVTPNSQDEVPYGEEGELCICGPTVMMGYLNNPKETNLILQKHKDGNIWLHTGDIATMNKDGIITYIQRLKRMIISSGYNIYPQHIENIIEKHEAVLKATVVGIPHPYKVEVAKAYIVLKDGYKDTLKIKKEIKELCEEHIPKYSLPYEYEYRESLPTTLIGKIDYKKLEREALEKNS